MNLEQSKKIPITWFYSTVLGLRGRRSANDILYSSPFRNDDTPSYAVSIHKNISYDFATGEARDLVGSISHHYGLSMSQSLRKLEELLKIYPVGVNIDFNNQNSNSDESLSTGNNYSNNTPQNQQKVPFNEFCNEKQR